MLFPSPPLPLSPSAPPPLLGPCSMAMAFANRCGPLGGTCRVNDVELLGSRLGKIEEALFRCLSVVEAANTPRYGSPPQPPSRPDSAGREDRDDSRRSSVDSDDSWSDGSGDPFSQADRDSGIELSDCGSPLASLYSEAQAVGDQLMAAMGMEEDPGAASPRGREASGTPDDSLRAHLADAGGLFHELATGPPPVSEPKYDDLPPALPPRTLLEGFVDAYFVELNPFLPIYDRQSVLDAIDHQYGSHSEAPDLAWVCSFNSILLHTLEAKSSAARPAGQMGDSTLERGLVVHLLLNARRCYNNFERLLQPRVANVQSLLSMVGRLVSHPLGRAPPADDPDRPLWRSNTSASPCSRRCSRRRASWPGRSGSTRLLRAFRKRPSDATCFGRCSSLTYGFPAPPPLLLLPNPLPLTRT